MRSVQAETNGNFFFYFYFILLYNTVLVLPYIDMNRWPLLIIAYSCWTSGGLLADLSVDSNFFYEP